jgi:hypothetical protein
MKRYEEIVKAGCLAKAGSDAMLLLIKCLVAINYNAFNVDKLKTYKVEGVKSEG